MAEEFCRKRDHNGDRVHRCFRMNEATHLLPAAESQEGGQGGWRTVRPGTGSTSRDWVHIQRPQSCLWFWFSVNKQVVSVKLLGYCGDLLY